MIYYCEELCYKQALIISNKAGKVAKTQLSWKVLLGSHEMAQTLVIGKATGRQQF